MTTTEAEALRAEIQELAPTKQMRRYPTELQERVTEYARGRVESGVSVAAVCAELDVGEPTLRRFLGLASPEKEAGFARLRVSPKRVATGVPTTLVVRAAGGVTVEGLSLEGVAELLKRLSCSA